MSEEVKLGRVGHFNNPLFVQVVEGVEPPCWTARITKVWSDTMINVAGEDADGNHFARTSVPVADPSGNPSFHFNRDCPYER